MLINPIHHIVAPPALALRPAVLGPLPAPSLPMDTYVSHPYTLKAPEILFPSLLPATIPPKLQQAADLAFRKYKNKAGACEATTNHLHRLLLGDAKLSVRYLPKAQGLHENGQPLAYLKTLIEENRLKPGMVVFINTDPAMKMPRLSPSNRHWFTYMGLDPATQKPVFCDQYGSKRSLEKILALRWSKEEDIAGLRERKLHTIFDPYRDRPGLLQ